MNIFNFLNDILYTKKGGLLNDPDYEKEFVPYMICRWLSMHSPDAAKIINLTYNKLYSVYDTKQEWYQSLLGVIPRSKFKKLKYLKKAQKEETKENNKEKIKLQLLAKTYQMSLREVDILIKEHNIDLKKVIVN
jgi:hypothetical protein